MTVDLTHSNNTIAKLSEISGLDLDAANSFRVVAHTVLSRKQTHFVGVTSYGEGIRDEDQAIIDAGLITVGPFEANDHPMSLSHQGNLRATLTAAGLDLAERTVRYETAIRARHMDADDFADWKRSVSFPI